MQWFLRQHPSQETLPDVVEDRRRGLRRAPGRVLVLGVRVQGIIAQRLCGTGVETTQVRSHDLRRA